MGWVGPGKEKSKISEANYVKEIPGKRDRTQIYHVNMLKPYYTRSELVNLISYERNSKQMKAQDLDIPYLENSHTIFDLKKLIIVNKKNSWKTVS